MASFENHVYLNSIEQFAQRNNLLTYQRLILLYYFHRKFLKEKTAIFTNTSLFVFYCLWYHDLSLYKKSCLHNLCMIRALLDYESLDRVSWTCATLWLRLFSCNYLSQIPGEIFATQCFFKKTLFWKRTTFF